MRRSCCSRGLRSSWTTYTTRITGAIVSRSTETELLELREMESNEEVWADWLRQDNEYAAGDRRAMEAGGGTYLNFIKIVLRKK